MSRARKKLTPEEEQQRIEKLPAWARQIIDRQQSTIRGLREELGGLMRPADPGDECQYESWDYVDTPLPARMALPNGRFLMSLGVDKYGRQHEIALCVETDYQGHKCVRVSGMHGPLTILPVASNTVTLTTLREERD